MIELAEHIEALLLENDCVIVPGLGGFVGHYTPAMRVDEENRFLSPARVIGFNPSLKMNDGLLVQSYASVYGTSFSDATHRVEHKVHEVLDVLHQEGKVEFPNIGELRYSIYDSFSFIPYDHKLTTPYLYGMSSFEMNELAAAKKPVKPLRTPLPVLEPRSRTHARYLSRHMRQTYFRNALGVVAALVLFFFLSTPVENTGVVEENYAHLLPSELFSQLGQSSLVTTPVRVQTPAVIRSQHRKSVTPVAVKEVKVKDYEVATAQPVVSKPVAEPTAVAKPARTAVKEVAAPVAVKSAAVKTSAVKTVTVKPTAQKPYHIIVASVGTEKDARNMAKKLQDQGYRSASAVIGGGKMRVSIQTCQSRQEAYTALKSIRSNESYKSAWVLH